MESLPGGQPRSSDRPSPFRISSANPASAAPSVGHHRHRVGCRKPTSVNFIGGPGVFRSKPPRRSRRTMPSPLTRGRGAESEPGGRCPRLDAVGHSGSGRGPPSARPPDGGAKGPFETGVPAQADSSQIGKATRHLDGCSRARWAPRNAASSCRRLASRVVPVVGSMPSFPADGTPLVLEVARSLLDAGQVKTIADLKGNIAIEGEACSGSAYLADLVLKKIASAGGWPAALRGGAPSGDESRPRRWSLFSC